METIHQRDIIRTVAADYREHNARYFSSPAWGGADREAKSIALAKLDGETATVADVASIVDPSWVALTCGECGTGCETVARFGYDESRLDLCRDCLLDAAAKLQP